MGEVVIRFNLEEWMAYLGLTILLIYTITSAVSTMLRYKLLKLRKKNVK